MPQARKYKMRLDKRWWFLGILAGLLALFYAFDLGRLLSLAYIKGAQGELEAHLDGVLRVDDRRQGLWTGILGTIHTYPTLAEANKYVAGNWKRAHAPQALLAWVTRYHAWRRG